MMNPIQTLAMFMAAGGLFLAGCETTTTGERRAADAASGQVARVETAEYVGYGETVSPTGPTVSVAQVLGNVEQYQGKPVRVEGTVSKVCQSKGCWLEMSDGSKALFVKFTCPIEGRLIPLDAPGKRVIAQGELKIKEISEDDARHLAEESGEPEDQVKNIVGPQKQITLASPGAIVFK